MSACPYREGKLNDRPAWPADRQLQRHLQQQGIQAKEVQQAALSQLLDRVCLYRPENARFDEADIFSVLLYAAATASALEPAGRNLKDSPAPNTVREALKPLSLEEVEGQLNQALLTEGVRRLLCHPVEMAIDLTEVPYYGDPQGACGDFIWKRKSKLGTSHFFVYASAYVIQKGQRVTLAVHACRKSQGLLGALKWITNRILELGGQICCLYLDREFYSVEVIRYLQERVDLPFCMAAPQKGKPDGAGLKALVERVGPGLYPYTVKSQKKGSVDVTVAAVGHYLMGRWGKHERVRYTYLIHRFPFAFSSISPKYRTRFGIESSYRIEEQARARTTSQSPMLRLFLFALALVLQNLWVWLQWACISIPRRGGRKILYRCFTFFRMLSFLRCALETQYQLVEQVCLKPG